MRSLSLLFVTGLALAGLAACRGSVGDSDYAERMAREHSGDSPVASPAAQVEPGGKVVSEEVVYADLEGARISGQGLANGPSAG